MTNQEAIVWLKETKKHYGEYHEKADEALEIAIKALEDQPQGEWIDYSNEGYVECPFCQSATTCEDNKDELHYCFNCGAKLN